LGYDVSSREITYYTTNSNATTITITDVNTNATYYPTFVSGSGTQPLLADISNIPLSYNPSTGAISGQSLTGTAYSTNDFNFVKLGSIASDSTTNFGFTGYGNLRTSCGFGVGVGWLSNGAASPGGFVPNGHATFLAGGSTVSGDIRSNASNTTTYNTSSDYRLKENITEISDAIERVRRLRPVSFQFKDVNNDIVYDGFLAHEVQEVISYAVSGVKDAVTEDGDIIPQMIDMSTMVGLLTACIKELDARLAKFEAKV
jgi:hypothetical protein